MELPVLLAAYYGLRRSEVIGLRWQSVDFINKCITISHTIEVIRVDGEHQVIAKDRTKNKSSCRTLPLIPAVEAALRKAKARQDEKRRLCGRSYCRDYLEYVCVDEMGKLILPDYVSSRFREVLEKSEMRRIRFHDLRHSCASLLLANGISIKEIQLWLGHSNFSTTANIYAHLDMSSKQAAANMMQNCILHDEPACTAEKRKTSRRKSA